MDYKIQISVMREDGHEVFRNYKYNPDKNYNEEVESLVETLEEEKNG
ncbi:MAG: hypothetical protein ACP5N7_05610 [Candidatus Pacearchaeota archaeon]